MSELGVNFVAVNQEANKSGDFADFVDSLVTYLKVKLDDYIENVILVFDGATSHGSLIVREALKENSIRGLMQISHSPGKITHFILISNTLTELNAAEHYIHYHKSIIRSSTTYQE